MRLQDDVQRKKARIEDLEFDGKNYVDQKREDDTTIRTLKVKL